jgi:MFS family permease
MLNTDEVWENTKAAVASRKYCIPSPQFLYLSSTVFGAAGRNAYFVGGSWVLAEASKQAGSIVIFPTLGCIIELVSSAPAGRLADRVDRRLLCVLCDVARLLVMLCTCAGLLVGPSDYVLFVSVVVYSVVDRIYLTALPAIIPSLVGPESLLRFNAQSYVGMQAGNMVAAASAGLLLNVSPHEICFVFAALAFAFSLISMAALTRNNTSSECIPTSRPEDAVSATQTERTWRLPMMLVVSYALTYTMGMLISILASVFILQELDGNAMHFGLLEAGWAFGAIIGAALFILRAMKRANGRAIPPIVVFLGVVVATLFMTRGIVFCILLISFLGAAYNVARLLVEVEIQRLVPNARLGRAKGEVHLVCSGFSLLLYLALATFGKLLLPSTIFLVYGVAMITCITGIYVWANRRKFLASGAWKS